MLLVRKMEIPNKFYLLIKFMKRLGRYLSTSIYFWDESHVLKLQHYLNFYVLIVLPISVDTDCSTMHVKKKRVIK